jgi:hypothetical protein
MWFEDSSLLQCDTTCYVIFFLKLRHVYFEDSVLLGCDDVSLGEWFLMFQRIVVPSASKASG